MLGLDGSDYRPGRFPARSQKPPVAGAQSKLKRTQTEYPTQAAIKAPTSPANRGSPCAAEQDQKDYADGREAEQSLGGGDVQGPGM